MPAPGIITGGDKSFFKQDPTEGNAESRRGIFGTFPGATPKYALNRGTRDAEYSDTVARLFIELPPTIAIQDFLKSLPKETQKLGEILATGGASGGTPGTGFIDFILTSSQEGFQEKTQIVNTLTDNYVAFYAGQEAPVFQYSGVVLNTYQDDQRVWMLMLYRDILRGTRLAQRGLIASLRYDSFLVRGYLENLSMGLESSTQMSGRFQFNMRVKEMVIHTPMLALPTVSTQISAGVIPRQTTVGQRTDVVRIATLTPNNPPTAVDYPAAEAFTGDFIPTTFTPADPNIFAVQQSVFGASNADEVQQFNEDLKNNNLFDTVSTADVVNFTPLRGNTENVTNDGLGGTTNIKNNRINTESTKPIVNIRVQPTTETDNPDIVVTSTPAATAVVTAPVRNRALQTVVTEDSTVKTTVTTYTGPLNKAPIDIQYHHKARYLFLQFPSDPEVRKDILLKNPKFASFVANDPDFQ